MKVKIVSSLLTVLLIFSGCITIPGKEKESKDLTILESQAALKFGDVPVPVGFRLLVNEAYSFESLGIRVGLLKYQGKGDVDRIVNFYKEQMPIYNWDLLNIVEYGQRLLNFDRDAESCIINLLNKGNNVTITISVGPKSQIIKNPVKPVK